MFPFRGKKRLRHEAVHAAMCFVYVHTCLGLVLCYGRPSLVWAVLKLVQLISLWHSRLFNTGRENIIRKHLELFVQLPVFLNYFAFGYIMNIKFAAFKLLGQF